jgi:LuxR family maltose regulon positive regulatory protein
VSGSGDGGAAPAGSGKTVLLRSWISGAGLAGRAAWVPVGRGERDPQRGAGYKRVRQIEFTDHIPRSLAGKILRRLLAAESEPAVTGFLPGG